MIRWRVGFSQGMYMIVHAHTPEEARAICTPMLSEGETIEYVEAQNLPALLKPQAE